MNHLFYISVKILFIFLLGNFSLSCFAQKGLEVATIFEKYGTCDQVTMVNLTGSILKSYDMTLYRSLVFEDVTPYRKEIIIALNHDASSVKLEKRQEIVQSGVLRSAYYQLPTLSKKGVSIHRYLLYKCNSRDKATLVYIEGPLSERSLMKILYRK